MKFEVGMKVRMKEEVEFWLDDEEVSDDTIAVPANTILEITTKAEWEKCWGEPLLPEGEEVIFIKPVAHLMGFPFIPVLFLLRRDADEDIEPLDCGSGKYCTCSTPRPVLLLSNTICDNCGKEVGG